MKTSLAYGKKNIELELPENRLLGIFSPSDESKRSEEDIINDALDSPIGSPPLKKILRKGEQTTIVIPDSTRRCGARMFLSVLLEMLNSVGIKDSDVYILFANGSHDPQTVAQQEAVVGPELLTRVTAINHDCRQQRDMVFLGDTLYGTPVHLNKHVVKAERLIVAGGVSFHPLTGYSGGPKLLNPGCAAYKTILACHGLGINRDGSGLNNACDTGVFETNPIYRDIVDSTKFVQMDFNLHLVINMGGKIIGACAGAPVESFAVARKMVNETYSVNVPHKVDLVVASCGGAPFDDDLLKAFRSIRNACRILKENGRLILMAECAHGIGSSTFLNYFPEREKKSLAAQLLDFYQSYGNTALALRALLRRFHVTIVGSLNGSDAAKVGVSCRHTVNEAISEAVASLSPEGSMAIMPYAHFTVANVREN